MPTGAWVSPAGLCDRQFTWPCLIRAVRPATGDDLTLVRTTVNTVLENVSLVLLPFHFPHRNPVEKGRLHLRQRFLSRRLPTTTTGSHAPVATPQTSTRRCP